MAKRKAKRKAKAKAKVNFFGHEIGLTFIGSLIIAFSIMLAAAGLQPLALTWLLAAMMIWLGLLVFLYPVIKKIEDLM